VPREMNICERIEMFLARNRISFTFICISVFLVCAKVPKKGTPEHARNTEIKF
jgi:hypothetical protein